MNVLALDTASPEPGVCLLAGGALFEEPLPGDRQASEKLLSAIARCLERAAIALSDCDRIAVCSGPGSFTGLRVGLSTAWGLGRAREIPVEAVSTLACLAEAARCESIERVTAALDAGRGEVVAETFSLAGPRAVSLSGPQRVPRETAASTGSGPVVCLPAELLGPRGSRPATSVSRALALSVATAPGPNAAPSDSMSRAIYSRPSAAEEKHGAP
jgi:tRNA threonylcarbamoyladenosine biosynthesis protein TsaB